MCFYKEINAKQAVTRCMCRKLLAVPVYAAAYLDLENLCKMRE